MIFSVLRRMRAHLFVCLTACTALLTGGAAMGATTEDGTASQAAPKLPLQVFAALPSFSHPKLSPDGKQIAFYTQIDGRRAGVIQNLDGTNAILAPAIDKADIVRIEWASNDRLLIAYSFEGWRNNFHGFKTSERRLFAVDRDGKNITNLGRKDRQMGTNRNLRTARNGNVSMAVDQARIVSTLPKDPKHILLAYDDNVDNAYEVRKVNINNGAFSIAKREHMGIQWWYTDHADRIRLGYGYVRVGTGRGARDRFRAFVIDGDGKGRTMDDEWVQTYDIEGFAEDPDTLIISKINEQGRDALYSYSIASGDIAPLYAHDDVDIDYVIDHPETGIAAGVAYTTDMQHYHYFDADLRKLQRSLEKVLSGHSIEIVDKATGQEIYIIRATNDTNPGTYYWLDRQAKNLMPVAYHRNGIDPQHIAPTHRETVTARDGVNIPTYVTLPKSSDGKNLPTIVYPHGGPWARSTAEYDSMVAYFANRGYAVIQPNFRGSSGYGAAFSEAGHRQWGGKMQDDVTDVTHWAFDQGIADPDRTCIVGWSYGGYAAAMGAAKEPDLYRCAASINGVTDLVSLRENDKNFIGFTEWRDKMGHETLSDKEVSPYHLADRIKVPVLFFAAEDDLRVPKSQSVKMAKRLKKQGTPVEIGMSDFGGHGLWSEASKLQMLEMLDAFLAKHNPVDAPGMASTAATKAESSVAANR